MTLASYLCGMAGSIILGIAAGLATGQFVIGVLVFGGLWCLVGVALFWRGS